jgi:anti-anti-sigma factor
VTILQVESAERDGLVHVSLRGELDLSTVGKVDDELERWEVPSSHVLLLDLSELTFLDSTGLRCVVRADERAREEGRRLVVVKGPEAVQRVFEITRLQDRIELVDDASSVQGG